jgi:hypothetical protein
LGKVFQSTLQPSIGEGPALLCYALFHLVQHISSPEISIVVELPAEAVKDKLHRFLLSFKLLSPF